MDNAPVKVKNAESGTITAQLGAAEVTSMNVDPVPQYAPGVLVMNPGTEEEEHIFFRKRDSVGGTVSGLIRDITNLNGGSGFLHINGTSWESMQASEYINFIVEALLRGWMVEAQIIAYVSGTSFTVQGNQTDRYTQGRFLRIDESDAKIAVVTSSSYNGGSGLTTVVTRGFAIPDPVTTIEVQIGQPNGFTSNAPIFYGEDAGGDDTYAVTVEPDFGAYFKGMIIMFEATTANTGACTLNINTLGAKDIKTLAGGDPVTGEIAAGHMAMLIYNGTNFRLLTSALPGVIDEDDMTSDSAVRLPTQQSVKAYIAHLPVVVGIMVVEPGTDVATGDGKAYYRIPSALNGYNLIDVQQQVFTAGTTGTQDVQIRNVTQAADMLSTKSTVDSGEKDSSTAAAAAVIDTANDDVATGDQIAIDVDAVQTTKAKGLYIEMKFQLP